jgi:hypothetical protein
LGDFGQANQILETIIGRFGVSLWTMEKTFLLKDASAGLEANKSFLTEFVKDETNPVLLKFLAQFVSTRSESKLSPENYRLKLYRAFDSLTKEGFPSIIDYLLYRLDYFGKDLSTIATDITYFEGSSPIFDRYLTFLALCQACAVRGEPFREIVSETVQRLDGQIQDPRVDGLLQFCVPSRQLRWNELSANVLKVLDCYTDGDYGSSASCSARLLLENPAVYELYYIYIYSQGYLGQPFEQIFPAGSLAASLLKSYDAVTRGGAGWKINNDAILKATMSLWRDPLAYGLYDFYFQETQRAPDKVVHKLALLNATHVNPRFARIFDDTAKAEAFLDQLNAFVPNSSTVALLKGLMTVNPWPGVCACC